MVASPELCRVVEEFLPHHQEGHASQRRFLCNVRDLINIILMNVNPFGEQLRGLVSLEDKVCESPISTHSVYFLESTGKDQFKTYQESILHSRKIVVTAPIKRNKLQIDKDTKVKRKSAMKLKVDLFKQPAEFFWENISNSEKPRRRSDRFVSHDSSSWPPALSSGGLLHTCAKSDLLKCLLGPTTSNFDDKPMSPTVYDFIVFDGGYLIHTLTRKSTKGKPSENILKKCFFPKNST